jgi:hypothetical protein
VPGRGAAIKAMSEIHQADGLLVQAWIAGGDDPPGTPHHVRIGVHTGHTSDQGRTSAFSQAQKSKL